MKWPQFIFTALVIATVAIDVVMINIFGVQGSLSQWVRDMAHTSPYFVLGIGILIGHFFANMETRPRDLIKGSYQWVNRIAWRWPWWTSKNN